MPVTSASSAHDTLAGYTIGVEPPFDFTAGPYGPAASTNVVDTVFTAPQDGIVTAIKLAVRNDNATAAQFSWTTPPTPTGAFSTPPIAAGADGVIRFVFDTPFAVVAGQTFGINPQNGNGFAIYSSLTPSVAVFNFGSTNPVAAAIEYQ